MNTISNTHAKSAGISTAGISITALDLTTQCESGYEFEYINSAGKESGIFLTVLGSQAPKVQGWIRKSLNRRRVQEAMQVKRGKEVERLIEDDEEFGNEAAAVRITAWRGITEPYTPELALHLCSINAEIRDQVFKASNELANFTKG